MEEVLWRKVSVKAKFGVLKALGHRKDIVETCVGDLIFLG